MTHPPNGLSATPFVDRCVFSSTKQSNFYRHTLVMTCPKVQFEDENELLFSLYLISPFSQAEEAIFYTFV